MSPLPLKLRVAVRDQWDAPASDVQQSLTSLKEVLGVPIELVCNWEQLLDDTKSSFKSPDELVSALAGLATAWAQVFTNKLEQAEGQAWVDELVDAVTSARLVRVIFSVTGPPALMTWNPKNGVFELDGIPSSKDFTGFCETQFAALEAGTLSGSGGSGGSGATASQYQASLPVHSNPVALQSNTITSTAPTSFENSGPLAFPSLDKIPRPEALAAQAPYYLTIIHRDANIEIMGTHQPTMELIKEYFTKHARPNRGSSEPNFRVETAESTFGAGFMHGHLYFYKRTSKSVHVLQIVAFAEAVLGYVLIPQMSSTAVFSLRRATSFA